MVEKKGGVDNKKTMSSNFAPCNESKTSLVLKKKMVKKKMAEKKRWLKKKGAANKKTMSFCSTQ